MNSLTKKGNSPFPSVFNDFFDTDQFFGSLFRRDFLQSLPSVNITENERSFEIELAAPGMTKQDFKIKVENNFLTISAEKEEKKEDTKERYTRREFSYNSFSRSFRLPEDANAEGIKGRYEDGILKLQVPKKDGLPGNGAREITLS